MWSSRVPIELEYIYVDCDITSLSVESPAEYIIFKILIEKIRPNRID